MKQRSSIGGKAMGKPIIGSSKVKLATVDLFRRQKYTLLPIALPCPSPGLQLRTGLS